LRVYCLPSAYIGSAFVPLTGFILTDHNYTFFGAQ
jgi:hypothetical protein